MVQALARSILKEAEQIQAQDIYILPKEDQYGVWISLGD